jgi:preprotein translocase subunit SecF
MKETSFDFLKMRRPVMALSLLLVIISMVSLSTRGLNLGLDFTGGTLIEVRYQQVPDISRVRQQLSEAGFINFTVVNFGAETDVLVRLQQSDDPLLGDRILELLQRDGSQLEKRRIDYVGPQIGDELLNQGGLGLLLSVGVMMIYIALRFQFKFSVGAALALVHDVVITLGIFSFFGWNFDLTVLAAVLALIGYSLNDTIVVFDRIREMVRDSRKEFIVDTINKSLNQTLGRTINTSFTTALVLLSLFFFGGEAVRGFSEALLVGILVGTYSSIYIAASLLVSLKLEREDLLPPVRGESGAYDDGMP